MGIETNTINIVPLASWYKVLVVVLSIANIFIYHKKDIGNAIIEDFKHCVYIWISLGILLAMILMFCADDTHVMYETIFTTFGFFLSLSYLHSQYTNAKDHQIGHQLWLKVFILAIIDILGMIFISKKVMFIILLVQTYLAIWIYKPEPKKE